MKLSKISIYRYSLVMAIFALMFSLFGKFVFAESMPGDIPMTDNIIHDNDGIIAGSSKTRANNADRTSYNYYYNSFNLYWKISGSSIRLYGKTATVDIDYRNVIDDGSERTGTTTRNGTVTTIGGETVYKYEDMSGYPDGFSIWQTNIPIFRDDEDIEIYLATGDYTNADNVNDVTPQPDLNNEIPKVTKISITKQSTQQQQNIFINDVIFTVESEDLSQIQGSIEGDYFVDLNLLRHRNIAGVTQDTILNEGNDHTSNWVVSGTKTYNDDNTYTVTIPASTLNSFVSQIYEDNDLVSGISSFFSEIYLNQLTISARNEYIQGSEFVVGSWSESYNFTYNYVTKSASAYESPQPNDTDGATDVPAVTPNDEQQNGYNNGDSNISIDAQIKNDYPKYDLWQNLNKTLESSGEVKTSLNNAWGLFGTLSENGLIAILGQCMPFVPQEIWNLFTLAITTGISFLICGALFRFLRG